ncbi:MAG: CopD family protein [Gammaproteobacteria bacterium]
MTILSLYIVLHVISVVVWVGGMIFAHQFLRPVAAKLLEPPQRLPLWVGVFSRFFPIVWICIILLPLTGYLMIFKLWGGFAHTPIYVHIMNGMGILMILIFLHVFFAPFRRLKKAVTAQTWPEAGKALNQIRFLVGLNTLLGLFVIVIAAGGRFF